MSGTATQLNESGLLVIGIGKQREFVSPSEVIYLAGEANYSPFVRREKPPVTASITLARYEKTLPAFIRIHKRFLVNPAFVKQWISGDTHGDGSKLLLRNGNQLPIARRRIKTVIKQFSKQI